MKHLFLFLIFIVTFSCATRSFIKSHPNYKRSSYTPTSREEISQVIQNQKEEIKEPPKDLSAELSSDTPASPSPETKEPFIPEVSWEEKALHLFHQPIKIKDKTELIIKVFEDEFTHSQQSIQEMAKIIHQKNPALLEFFDYWLLKKLWHQEKYDEASSFASSLINSQNPIIQKTAQYLYEQYYLVKEASSQKIGVLIKGGARQQTPLLHSLRMAFGISSQSETETPSPFQLIIVDEPDTFDELKNAFHHLVNKENVITIFGGTRNKTRPFLAQLSQQYKIPFIYLGQKSQVTSESPYFFQYGLSLEPQIRSLAHHAFNRGIRKLAIVYPNDGFGVEAANLMWDEWITLGGKVVAARTYHPEENDFQEIAALLSNKTDISLRITEFKKIQSEKLKNAPHLKRRILSQSPIELLPAEYEYQAIFIPDLNKTVAKLLSALAYYGVRHLPIYGIRLLATPDTHKLIGPLWSPYLTISESAFAFIDHLPIQHPFILDFKNRSKIIPDPLSVNAFEAGILIKEAILQKAPKNRKELKQILEDKFFTTGILGQSIYFDEYREIDHPILLLQYNVQGQFIIIR